MRADALEQEAGGWRFTHPAFADIFGEAVTPDARAAAHTALVADLDPETLAPGETVRWVGRALEARGVRNGMPGLHNLHELGRPGVAVAGDREPGEPVTPEAMGLAVVGLGDLRAGARALASGEDDDLSRRRSREVGRHADGRMGGGDGRIEGAAKQRTALVGRHRQRSPS